MRALIDPDPLTALVSAERRGNFLSNRTIQVALVLSVLAHVVAMWGWHPQMRPTFELKSPSDESGPLQLRLEPKASKPAAPSPPEPQRHAEPQAEARPAPPKRELVPPKPRPTPPAPRARPAPPEPMTKPAVPAEPPQYSAPESAPAPVLPPVTESAPKAAPGGDLSSYIASRRRSREGAQPSRPSAPAVAEESDAERATRIAEANLGVGRAPSHGQDLTGGGIFQIKRLGYDYAEYLFYGWNVDIRRNATQLVTVRKGAHADIRKAVVRSMIDIIRRHEQGDFLWESRRLGRNVNLSARAADDAGLEGFLMKEFFDDPGRSPVSRAP